MLIIGLNGYMGAGKSQVAKALVEQHDFRLMKFAHPLKEMLRAMYRAAGMNVDLIERKIEGDLKRLPCPYLGGKTPTYAMQTLGSEWGRNLIDADHWIRIADRTVINSNADKIVFDDCRFPNEADIIRSYGGVVWRISRAGVQTSAHTSESEQVNVTPDFTLWNNGTLADLTDSTTALLTDTFHLDFAA